MRGGFLCGFVLGAVVGTVGMLLLAPRPGATAEGTRHTQLETLRAGVRERVDALVAQGRQALEEGREAAEELRREFDAALDVAQRQ